MVTNSSVQDHAYQQPHMQRTSQVARILSVAVSLLLIVGLGFVITKPIRVLPYQVEAPSYTLLSDQGGTVTSSDLKDQVVLYNFIYTHCTTVCPALTGQMLQTQNAVLGDQLLRDHVTLVTITFDPERDSVARLQTYASEMNASAEGWIWLTGDLIEIKRVVGGEFGVYFEKVPLGGVERSDDTSMTVEHGYDFIHENAFILVDSQGIIRAEYRDLIEVRQMVQDLRRVVREEQANGLLAVPYRLAHMTKAYP